MTDQELIEQGTRECERICERARDLRQAAWPQVVDGFVAFHEGDRRFEIYPELTFYVEAYRQDTKPRSVEMRFWTLGTLLTDPDHVRELVEVITS